MMSARDPPGPPDAHREVPVDGRRLLAVPGPAWHGLGHRGELRQGAAPARARAGGAARRRRAGALGAVGRRPAPEVRGRDGGDARTDRARVPALGPRPGPALAVRAAPPG